MLGGSLRLAAKVVQSNFGLLRRPYKLNFITTKECHSRCVNCHIWKTKPKDELTLAEIRMLARKSPFLSWINFSGGEATDRPDFVEIVGAFVENCPEMALIHFPTNGMRPERIAEAAGRIAALNPPSLYVTVSIDGPPAVHDRLRGVPGNFESAIKTFLLLREIRGVSPFVGMTIFADNSDLITETVDSIRRAIPDFGYSKFHANLAHISPHYYENAGLKRTVTKEMIAAVRAYRAARGPVRSPVDWMEDTFHRLAERYIASGQTPIPCSALETSCFLTQDGTVHPCSIWKRPLGNIRETDFDLTPILASAIAREARREIARKECAHCWTPCEAFQSIAASITSKR